MRVNQSVVMFVAAVFVAACNAVPGATVQPSTPAASATPVVTVQPTATLAPSPSQSAAPEGLVTSLDGVRGATVRIVAEGLVTDPSYGPTEFAGQGSGFIIDPSGTIVTNNHVVTGSSLRRVYIGGDNTHELPAVILGASECSDLAVLQIQPPGEYPYLDWYQEEIGPSAEQVFAIGYPDDVYRQDPGTVNTDPAPQKTQWSSANEVIEISNNIIPGNSGGPLVTADAEVVGVDYAGLTDTDQSFAIAATEAQRVVDQLREGTNVDYIGINGIAVNDPDSGISGVYVYGVQPGSPADNAMIKPADLIISLGGHSLSTDGTMADYCSILRNNRPTDPIDAQVFNLNQRACFEGQLNNAQRTVTTEFDCPFLPDETGQPPTALVAHVSAAFAATCVDEVPYSDATASVKCDPGDPAVSNLYYDQFASAATMNSTFTTLIASHEVPSGNSDCGTGTAGVGPYSVGGVTTGQLACFLLEDNTPEVLWTHDSLNIVATAFGTTSDDSTPKESLAALSNWWTGPDSGPIE